MQFESTPTRYTIALYWALTTMATVGFGDVVPGTNLERCFTMALQLVAGVLQGVVFGNISVAMAGFDRDASKVKSRLVEAKALARASSMPASLAARLAAASVAQAEAVRGLVVDDAMHDLAGGLRQEAEAAAIGARVLAAAPIFCDSRQPLPRGFVHSVARQLRVMALPAGELASSAGDPDGAAMLLFRGSCVSESATPPLDPASDAAPMTVYQAGAMFGEADAVLCRHSAADIFAAESSTLLAVSRASLDAALEDYPDALAPLTAACLAREAPEVDAPAAADVEKLVLERCESRKSIRLGVAGEVEAVAPAEALSWMRRCRCWPRCAALASATPRCAEAARLVLCRLQLHAAGAERARRHARWCVWQATREQRQQRMRFTALTGAASTRACTPWLLRRLLRSKSATRDSPQSRDRAANVEPSNARVIALSKQQRLVARHRQAARCLCAVSPTG